MEIVDEDGRLFGAVNVVDALVVLVVVAVALAGIALVTSEGPVDTETRYVTLDLGTQPEFVADQIDVGDTATLDGQFGNMTITDVYLSPSPAGVRATARVAVAGRATEGQFTFGGEPLRLGRQLAFRSDTYVVNGTIRDLGNGPDLSTQERTVVLRDTVPADVARSVAPDNDIQVGGETVATIDDVAVYDAENASERTLYVEATLRTRASGDTARFGETPVEVGRTIELSLAGARYNGTVERIGGGLDQRTDEVIVTAVVGADTAAQLDAGDTYAVNGRSVASIETVQVYDTGDPGQKRVYAGLSIRTLGYGQEPRFGSDVLAEGNTIPFRTQSYEFGGTVLRYGTSNLQTGTNEVLVTGVVDVGVADRLDEGDNYTVAGRTVATVESLAVYGTDEPERKRIYAGLSVRTIGFTELPRFGASTTIREGATVPFRTQSYEFTGEIVRVGAIEQVGEPAERTVTLEMENVPPERANSVEPGLTETNAGQTIARVLDVRVEPAVITLTSESGNIFEREHPVNKDVTLTVELQVREQRSGIRFKGRILQEGNEVVLDLGTTTVRATVVDLDGT